MTRPLLLGMGWSPDRAGGLNRYVRGLAEALGAPAVVLGPARDAPATVAVPASSSDPLPLRLLAYARAAAAAGRNADVVDAHFALYALLPLLGPLRRKPLVVHFHGPWADESAAAGESPHAAALKRFVERAVYRRAAAVVTLSEAFARLAEGYGVPRSRITVIPPGVDLERFSPGDRAAARARLGVSPDAFVGVCVRRLVPRMGVDCLLEAWRRLDGVLLVAGDGPERAQLERAAGPGVRLLGSVDETTLVDAYRAADVCVVPSIRLEGFGLVVLEALACGTPVVVSDAGGLPETVAGLDPSLVVAAGDADALARRLGLPLPAREACRAHAERFSWARAADAHRALYRRAAAPRRRLRVVYVDHTARLSGGELALLRLLPALRDEVDAHVVLGEDGPLAARLAAAGIAVEVLPLAGAARGLPRERVGVGAGVEAAASLLYALRLARRLRQLRPDLVHTNSLKAALYGGVAGRLARVPVVWHVRDRIAGDYLPPAAVRLVRAAARILPAAVVANSQATLATIGVPGHVLPSPVLPLPAAPPRSGPLRVGMVGRIAPWKGQDVFVRAFARAFPGGPETAAVVGAPLFGPDEEAYADGLRGLCASLGLDDRVEFRGFREEVAEELARIDVLVHASVLPEPFGQVVVEGMAAGLPVVAAAAGAPAEIVESEVTGLLVPPGDEAALAAALRRLGADAPLRRRLGDAARERTARYAPEAIAARAVEIYRSVLR